MCHVSKKKFQKEKLSFKLLILILGSAYDAGLNGASLSSLFPLAAPFLSTAGHLLGDTSGIGTIPPPVLPSSTTTTNASSSSSTPSLLSAAGSNSPVVVPVSIGESALQSAAKAAAASHGNNNNNNNVGESTGGDSMH